MSAEHQSAPQLVQQLTHGLPSGAGQGDPGSVIDIEAALVRMGRDRSLLEDVAQFFLEDAPSLLTQIRAAVKAGCAEDVGQMAHSLKGLVSNFDAMSAQQVAAEVEQHGWSGRLQAAEQLLDTLEQEVSRVIAAVRAQILSQA